MKIGLRPLTLLALVLAALCGFDASAQSCPPGNLLEGAGFRARGTSGSSRLLSDRVLAREGEPAGPGNAYLLDGASAVLEADLQQVRTIRAVLLQGEGGAGFVLEGSHDAVTWRPIWSLPVVAGDGLRLRTVDLDPPAEVRYLRLRTTSTAGPVGVSELAPFCTPPPPWPPSSAAPAATHANPAAPGGEGWPGRQTVGSVKFGIAVAGLLLFATGAWLRGRGRSGWKRRWRDGLLVGLALLAVAGWWNLGRFHFGEYLHNWEHFHYYVGSKYFAELDYTRLYDCALVADVEAGLGDEVATRTVRDLATNELGSPDAILADPGRCKRHFSDERWQAFTRDVGWFREQGGAAWKQTFRDHGYNPTPVWGMVGGLLTGLGPASDRTLLLLALFDPLLLLATGLIVIWAFGWRGAATAAIWWGSNLLAEYGWTGGGFLRQDWFFLAVAGVCLVRRRYPVLGGFALTWAALIRIFPGFIVVGLILRTLASMIERRSLRPEPAHLRFGAGCLLALALLVPLSSWSVGGLSAWRGFVDNSRASTRSTGTNTVGLMSILSYEPSGAMMRVAEDPALDDPQARWLAGKREAFSRRRPLFWPMLIGYLLLLGAAVRRQDDAGALILGVGLIPIASFLACYYYSILALAALRREGEREWAGIVLCALSLFSHVAFLIWRPPILYDQRFAWISLATVIVVVALTWIGLRRPDTTEEVADA